MLKFNDNSMKKERTNCETKTENGKNVLAMEKRESHARAESGAMKPETASTGKPKLAAFGQEIAPTQGNTRLEATQNSK